MLWEEPPPAMSHPDTGCGLLVQAGLGHACSELAAELALVGLPWSAPYTSGKPLALGWDCGDNWATCLSCSTHSEVATGDSRAVRWDKFSFAHTFLVSDQVVLAVAFFFSFLAKENHVAQHRVSIATRKGSATM